MSRAALLVLLASAGCNHVALQMASPRTEPIPSGWVLVNRSYSELVDLDRSGVAQVAPNAVAFVIEPVFESGIDKEPSSRPACHHEIRILYVQPGPLGVGDTAEARLSVEAGLDEEHIVHVTPTRAGIILMTPATMTIPPNGTVFVRFKGLSAGEGGVAVRVIECRPAK